MKTIFTLAIILLFGTTIKAQTPEFLWEKVMNSSFPNDFGISIFDTPDNGFVILSNKSQEDYNGNYWLFKLDSDRNVIWEKFYGGTGNDEPGNMIATADGNYLMAGSSNSQNGDVSGNHGASDIWLMEVDVLGNIIWKKSYGGSGSELYGKAIKIPGNGYLLIASSDSIDGDAGDNNGSSDYWVVKISDSGEIEWQNNFGGSEYEAPVSAISTSSNEYIIVGYSLSSDGDITNPKGDFDYWVIKVDSTGELVWEKSFGGSYVDKPQGIIRDHGEDDEFLVFGNSNSFNEGGDISNPLGNNDGWVIKIDGHGNLIWDRSFGGPGNDGISDFKLSPNNGYIYSGVYQEGQLTQSTVEETDAEGNEIWQMLFGSVGWAGIEPYLHEIKYSADGNLIAVGSNTTDISAVVWLGKIGLQNLGIEENLSKTLVSIYPNPIKDYLNIKSEEIIESITIHNALGQKVLNMNHLNEKILKLDLSQFTSGIYIANIQTTQNQQSIKIVKD